MQDPLIIAGKAYASRLLVGTGKYKDFAETREAIDASGAQIITVAIERMNAMVTIGSRSCAAVLRKATPRMPGLAPANTIGIRAMNVANSTNVPAVAMKSSR